MPYNFTKVKSWQKNSEQTTKVMGLRSYKNHVRHALLDL